MFATQSTKRLPDAFVDLMFATQATEGDHQLRLHATDVIKVECSADCDALPSRSHHARVWYGEKLLTLVDAPVCRGRAHNQMATMSWTGVPPPS